ncbi:MAG: FliM/FliN family flagellar motor C-terminal domain-containing protein [Phycisphaerae bacterium]
MTTPRATGDTLFIQRAEATAAAPAMPVEEAVGTSLTRRQSASSGLESAPEQNLRRILGLALPVTVTLAERNLAVEIILSIRVGTIIEFDVPFDAELILCVSGQPIGRGYAVKVGENFGLRVTSIDSVEHRIEALGGGSPQA